MKNKKLIGLMWAFALLPAVMVALCWGRLPDWVPTNWGFDGHITYGPKSTLWLLAALAPLIAVCYQKLPHIDPKKPNYERFQEVYDGFGVALPLFMTLMTALILVETLRPGTLYMARVITAVICVLFIGIGCIMGKVKSNWFMGIRTPWALADPDVWNKTHRLGGWVFFLSGLVNLPLALLAGEKVFFVTFFVMLFGGLALTIFMSWKWYQEKAAS